MYMIIGSIGSIGEEVTLKYMTLLLVSVKNNHQLIKSQLKSLSCQEYPLTRLLCCFHFLLYFKSYATVV